MNVQCFKTSNILVQCTSRKSWHTHEDERSIRLPPITSWDLWRNKQLGCSFDCVWKPPNVSKRSNDRVELYDWSSNILSCPTLKHSPTCKGGPWHFKTSNIRCVQVDYYPPLIGYPVIIYSSYITQRQNETLKAKIPNLPWGPRSLPLWWICFEKLKTYPYTHSSFFGSFKGGHLTIGGWILRESQKLHLYRWIILTYRSFKWKIL